MRGAGQEVCRGGEWREGPRRGRERGKKQRSELTGDEEKKPEKKTSKNKSVPESRRSRGRALKTPQIPQEF